MRSWLAARKDRAIRTLMGLVACLLIGLVYYLGVRSERSGFVQEVVDPGFRRLSDPVLNAFREKPPTVATLEIRLDSASWDSLRALESAAFELGHLDRRGNAAFAGTIVQAGREVAVVVSLLEGSSPPSGAWPIQVRALPGDTVLGMQTFDMVPILDEVPIWSFLSNAVLHELGQVTTGLALAEVSLNGKGLGLCQLYGKPDATMLQRWTRGGGPILQFDDELALTTNAEMAKRRFPSDPPPQGDWASAPLLVRSADGPERAQRAQRATSQLEAFRSGRERASMVFDVNEVAQLLATCDLLGTQASMAWWNLRFAVDSISGLLVPIPLHPREHAPITGIQATLGPSRVSIQGREVVQEFLNDDHLREVYLAYLDTFSSEGWWRSMEERTRIHWEGPRKVIHAEFPRFDLDLSIVEHDRTIIRQTLHPSTMVLAYMQGSDPGRFGIAVANVHELEVEVHSVILSTGDTLPLDPTWRLPPRARDRPLIYSVIPWRERPSRGTPATILVRLAPGITNEEVTIRSWTTFGAN